MTLYTTGGQLLSVGDVLAGHADCCCAETEHPDCENAPFHWLVTVGSMLEIFNQNRAVCFDDGHPRYVCNSTGFPWDFRDFNDSFEVTENGFAVGPVYRWLLSSLPYDWYSCGGGGAVNVTDGYIEVLITSSCEDLVGPGDVEIICNIRKADGVPSSSVGTVISRFDKTITLGGGQALKDYGSITMDSAATLGPSNRDCAMSTDVSENAYGLCTSATTITAVPTMTLEPNG